MIQRCGQRAFVALLLCTMFSTVFTGCAPHEHGAHGHGDGHGHEHGGGGAGSGCGAADAATGDAGITVPDVAPATAPKLSAHVLPIVKQSCAQAGCHDPTKKEHGMDLSTAATIHAGWVNEKSNDHCENNATVTRVVPGQPDASFVVTLIKNLDCRCSTPKRMPPAPMAALSAAEVKTISDWVAAGARND